MVRPVHILKKTLNLLKKKWRKEENYSYICDQFKSVRQDLTVSNFGRQTSHKHNINFSQQKKVQRIQNDFTVQVYEIHGRIALEKVGFVRLYISAYCTSSCTQLGQQGDLGEYNQCQTQLRELYKKGIPGRENEFIAYRLLYLLYAQNHAGMYLNLYYRQS